MLTVQLKDGREVKFDDDVSIDDMRRAITYISPNEFGDDVTDDHVRQSIEEHYAFKNAEKQKTKQEEPQQDLQAEQSPEKNSGFLGNMASELKSGAAQMAHGTVGLLNTVSEADNYAKNKIRGFFGADTVQSSGGIGDDLSNVSKDLTGYNLKSDMDKVVENAENSKTDSYRAGEEDISKRSGLTDIASGYLAHPDVFVGRVVNSIPEMAATAGLTNMVAKGIMIGAAEAFGGLGTELGQRAAKQAIEKATTELIATGGIVEGAQSAGHIAYDAQQAGKKFEDYAPEALAVGAGTALIDTVSGKMFGDAATDLATGTNTVKKDGLLKSILKQGTSESIEESPQSALEATAENSIYSDNPEKQKDVVNEAIHGGLIGFGSGVGMGAGHAAVNKTKELVDRFKNKNSGDISQDELQAGNDALRNQQSAQSTQSEQPAQSAQSTQTGNTHIDAFNSLMNELNGHTAEQKEVTKSIQDEIINAGSDKTNPVDEIDSAINTANAVNDLSISDSIAHKSASSVSALSQDNARIRPKMPNSDEHDVVPFENGTMVMPIKLMNYQQFKSLPRNAGYSDDALIKKYEALTGNVATDISKMETTEKLASSVSDSAKQSGDAESNRVNENNRFISDKKTVYTKEANDWIEKNKALKNSDGLDNEDTKDFLVSNQNNHQEISDDFLRFYINDLKENQSSEAKKLAESIVESNLIERKKSIQQIIDSQTENQSKYNPLSGTYEKPNYVDIGEQNRLELEDVNRRLDYAREKETRLKRDAVLTSVFDRNIPEEHIIPAFESELKRQGFNNTNTNDGDKRLIDGYLKAKAFDNVTSRIDRIESSPNEFDPYQFIKEKTQQNAQQQKGSDFSAIAELLNNGAKLSGGNTLVSNINGKQKTMRLNKSEIDFAKNYSVTTENTNDVQPEIPNAKKIVDDKTISEQEKTNENPKIDNYTGNESVDSLPQTTNNELAHDSKRNEVETVAQSINSQHGFSSYEDAVDAYVQTLPKGASTIVKNALNKITNKVAEESLKVFNGESLDETATSRAKSFADFLRNSSQDNSISDSNSYTQSSERVQEPEKIDEIQPQKVDYSNIEGATESMSLATAKTKFRTLDSNDFVIVPSANGKFAIAPIENLSFEQYANLDENKSMSHELAKSAWEGITGKVAPVETKVSALNNDRSGSTDGLNNEGDLIDNNSTHESVVKSPNNTDDFGEITPEQAALMGSRAGKIKLQQGFHDDATGRGFGKVHIDRDIRAEQLKDNGYNSTEELIFDVAQNKNAILKGKGNSFILAKINGKAKIAFVQIKQGNDGDFYSVGSGLISRKDYLKNKTLLWERAQSNQFNNESPSAVTGEKQGFNQSIPARDVLPIKESSAETSEMFGNQDKTMWKVPAVPPANRAVHTSETSNAHFPQDAQSIPNTREKSTSIDDKGVREENKQANNSEKEALQKLLKEQAQRLAEALLTNHALKAIHEEKVKILPLMTDIMETAFKLGYLTFKENARFVLDTIGGISKDAADLITIHNLRAGYVNFSQSGEVEGTTDFDGVGKVKSIDGLYQDDLIDDKNSENVNGNTVSISTPKQDMRVNARYEVVNDSTIITSHDTNLRVNPRFPQELQPRTRTDKPYELDLQNKVANFNPERVGQSATTDSGAPIVDIIGNVISGNGRAIALKKLNEKSYAEYKNWLMDNADKFGLDSNVIAKIPRPVLVHRLTDKNVNLGELARKSNDSSIKEMSVVEQAFSDADSIDEETFTLYDGGNLTSNRSFVTAFINATGADNIYNAQGMLSQKGITRIESAIMAKAYSNEAVVADFSENSNTEVKSLLNALLKSSANWLKLRAVFAETNTPDLTQNLADAVMLVKKARMSDGQTVKSLISQRDLMSGDSVHPLTEKFVKLFFHDDNLSKYISTDKVAEILNAVSQNMAKSLVNADVFGENLTSSQILDKVYEKYIKSKQETKPAPRGYLGDLFNPVTTRGDKRREIERREKAQGQGTDNAGVENEGQEVAVSEKPTQKESLRQPDLSSDELAKYLADSVRHENIGYRKNKDGSFNITIDGNHVATVSQQPISAEQAAEQVLRNYKSALDNEGKTLPSNPEDMTRDQFVIADKFGKLIQDFEISGLDIQNGTGGLKINADGTFGKDYDALYDRIQEQKNNDKKGDKLNVSSAATNLERHSADANAIDARDETPIFDAATTDARFLGQSSEPANSRGNVAHSDSGDSVSIALTGGEQGNNKLSFGNETDVAKVGITRNTGRERSGNDSGERIHDERIGSDPIKELPERSIKGLAPKQVKHIDADLENIKEAMPFLNKGQADDVVFAEKRLAGHKGVMFTNGTGTGKTFTGLGIVSRFINQGKDNILIVAPSQNILSEWVKAAKNFFGIGIKLLDDKSDAGKGVSATTYANFGDNPKLVNRDWDLIVTDESHYLMNNSAGNTTNLLNQLRGLTGHKQGFISWFNNKHHELITQMNEQKNLKLDKSDDYDEDKYEELKSEYDKERKLALEEWDLKSKENKSKVVMLSATPFAYETNIDLANGYLFNYGNEDGTGYNSGDGRERFFMQHLGYRMRYNRLTQPDAKVNRSNMQRNFNEWLKKQGALSARTLDVPFDYDRQFILTESAVGRRIDEALQWLSDNEASDLAQKINKSFDHLTRRYFLEAIKAKEIIPIIKEHLAVGRKVLVFHDYKKGGTSNPFNVKSSDEKVLEQFKGFRRAFPDLVSGSALEGIYSSPIEHFEMEFGKDALIYNGDIPSKERIARVAQFNDDNSGKNLILLQSASAKEGVSFHDTTGKHQRVLINIGLPTAPTTAIQQEGRIYRVGQKSDAIFRYVNTGTNWERWAFAQTIAGRASAAENLALGEGARGLRDAFINSFENSDSYPVGHEGEGKGGKEKDKQAFRVQSEIDRAKGFYYATQKKNSRTKSAEGIDYYATPEPVGFVMARLADARAGEKMLEPSAGHGAIARWFRTDAERTAIEPSSELNSRLALVFQDGDIKRHTFENLNIVNKYDAIVMNPPYGVGGKTAMEHLAKAFRHLRDGGRVVALIPEGAMADKRLSDFLSTSNADVKPIATLNKIGDIYAGDTVTYQDYELTKKGNKLVTKKDVIISTRVSIHNEIIATGENGEFYLDGSVKEIKPTGERPNISNKTLVADISLPTVTFERAGTKVKTHIVVIEKTTDDISTTKVDYSGIDNIEELFDRIDGLEIRNRTKTNEVLESSDDAEESISDSSKNETDSKQQDDVFNYKKKNGDILKGKLVNGITKDEAKSIDPYSWFHKDKESGQSGWFIREPNWGKLDALKKNKPDSVKFSKTQQLLAPNGKPSNLNTMQHAQVRTLAFKAWFGDWEAVANNDVINKQIEKYANGELPANVILNIGNPSAVLQQHGMPDLPITVRQAILKKAVDKHEVALADLKDIAISIQAPIAIFDDKDNENTRVVVSEIRHANGNIIAAIRMNMMRDGLEINDIRSLHPKRDTSILRWIESGDLLGLDKNKGREWIENLAVTNPQQPQSLPAFNDSILYDADNIRNASKVVDENGEPLVVYHGSKNEFTVFNEKNGGIYFSPDKGFSNDVFTNDYLDEDGVFEVFLNSKNMFNAHWKSMNQEQKNQLREIIDSVIDEDDTNNIRESLGREDWDAFESFTDGELWIDTNRITQDRVVQAFVRYGFDGVFMPDSPVAGEQASSYVVFKSNQVKSATGNTGAFDSKNKNINHSKTNSTANKTHTTESFLDTAKSELDSRFGNGWFDRLLGAGQFEVISNNESLGLISSDSGENGKIEAFYNPNDGKVYFVPENISKKRDIAQLALHEIGVHMMRLGKNQDEFNAILREFKLRAKLDPKVKAAFESARNAGTADSDLNEEALAHFVDKHPALKLAQRFFAWFRQAVRDFASQFKGADKLRFIQWANKLSNEDLVYMATNALRNAPDELMFDDPTDSEAIVKASKEGYKGNNPSEAKEWLRAVEKGLDMSFEGRMNRAKAMGFDVEKKWYHGTDAVFSEFDLGVENKNTATNLVGIYLTNDKNEANSYGKNILELLTKAEFPFEAGRSKVTEDMISEYLDFLSKNESYPAGYVLAKKDHFIEEFLKAGYPKGLSGKEMSEVLKAGGYDSYKDGNHLAVLYPNDVRSIDAAFDIAEFDSANLLASKTTVSEIFKPIAEQAAKFKAALDKLMNNSLVSRPQPITVGEPSHVLKAAGVSNFPIIITRDVIRKATNEVRHDVPMSVIKNLPEILANPVAVFDSGNKKDGGLVILSEYKDKSGRSIMISLHLDMKERHLDVNKIASVYGREENKYFYDLAKQGKIRFLNQKKSHEWAQSVEGTMLQGGIPKKGSYQNYITEKDLINSHSIKFSKSANDDNEQRNFNIPEQTLMDKFVAKFQDDATRIRQYVKEIKQQGGTVNDDNDVSLVLDLAMNVAAAHIENMNKKFVEPLLERMGKLGLSSDDVGLLAYAKAAPERNEEIQSINKYFRKNGGGSGLTDEKAAEIIAAYKEKYGDKFTEIESLADDFQKITQHTIDILERSGDISEETANEWREKEYYVPMKGFEDVDENGERQTGRGIGIGNSISNKFSKTALGRNSQAGQILENIVRDAERAIVRAAKIYTAKSLRQLIKDNPDSHLWEADTKPAQSVLGKEKKKYNLYYRGKEIATRDTFNDARRFRKFHAEETGANKKDYSIVKIGGNPTVKSMLRPFNPNDDIAYFEKGKRVTLSVYDKQFVEAFNRLGDAEYFPAFVVFSKFNRFLRKTYTALNPVFIMTNAIMVDPVFGFFTNTGRNGVTFATKVAAKTFTHSFKALKEYHKSGTAKNSEWNKAIELFRENGGMTGAVYISSIEQKQIEFQKALARASNESFGFTKDGIRKAFYRATGNRFFELIEEVNQVGEQATRLATFKQAIDDGMSPAQAAKMAVNVTVNFGRRGQFGREMGAMWLFFNANMQGTQNLIDVLRNGEHKKQAWAIAAIYFMCGFLSAIGGDDDKDKDVGREMLISEGEKQRYGMISGGEGNRVEWKMPYGLSFFHDMGRFVARAINGGDIGNITGKLMSSLFTNFSPIGNPMVSGKQDLGAAMVGLAPTITKLPFMVGFNKTEFGGELYPENKFNPYLPDSEKVKVKNRGTLADDIAKFMNHATGGDEVRSGAIDVSPETLKAVVRTLFGGAGNFVYDSVSLAYTTFNHPSEVSVDKIPFVSTVVKTVSIDDYRRRYYDEANEVKRAHEIVTSYEKSGNTSALAKFTKENSGLLSLYSTKENKKDDNMKINGSNKKDPSHEGVSLQLKSLDEEKAQARAKDDYKKIKSIETKERILMTDFHNLFVKSTKKSANS